MAVHHNTVESDIASSGAFSDCLGASMEDLSLPLKQRDVQTMKHLCQVLQLAPVFSESCASRTDNFLEAKAGQKQADQILRS